MNRVIHEEDTIPDVKGMMILFLFAITVIVGLPPLIAIVINTVSGAIARGAPIPFDFASYFLYTIPMFVLALIAVYNMYIISRGRMSKEALAGPMVIAGSILGLTAIPLLNLAQMFISGQVQNEELITATYAVIAGFFLSKTLYKVGTTPIEIFIEECLKD